MRHPFLEISWQGRSTVNGFGASYSESLDAEQMVWWIGHLYCLHADSSLNGLVIELTP